MKLLTSDEIAVLREKVLALLGDVGLKVEHEEVRGLLMARGCTPAVDGRLRLPAGLVADFVSLQESRRDEPGATPPVTGAGGSAEVKPRPRVSAVMGCAFGPGPTRYHDYASGQTLPVNMAICTEMMKFADATPEIARVAPWFRQDVPRLTSAVENLVTALKLTRKTVGLDALNPFEVRYLVEISEIVTGQAGDSSYLAGSQCMTPSLILGPRAAQEMLERRKHGVKRFYVATMTMVGASAPVDLLAATALATAEVLSGLIAAFVICPEAVLAGTAATTVADMKSGGAAMNAPESALLDAAVKELMDACFGGHVSAHVRYAPTAKVPGLQAVAENLLGMLAQSRLLDVPPTYSGNGNLDMGGIGSPVQAMLDLEMLQFAAAVDAGPNACAETMSLAELGEVVRAGGNFLAADHTVRNFRGLWSPELLLRRQPGGEWDGSERAILDRCHGLWQENLARYQPPAWDEGILHALDDVVQRARAELLG